jgi:asparagine synthase (glutamine-hydrolysing)
MCGIVGHINKHGKVDEAELELACLSLQHRGPDGHGTEMINDRVGFGHTRLSFLDLGQQGAQPMANNSKEVWVSFNGEIYNYIELKEELKEHYDFQGASDTEVLLAAYEHWGMEMLQKIKGMFAFALFDQSKSKLYLVRDHFGIKPLYYYLNEEHLIFASELKGIHQFKAFKKELDYTSFCDYFVYRYVPSPKTIWQNTFKLKPAHFLEMDLNTFEIKQEEYWQLPDDNEKINEKELVEELGGVLENSVLSHARADVPIGSFLSGGYDSSAIAYLLKKNNYKPKTFSIGFSNWQKSEDYFAKLVADHLGLENKKTIADENSLNYIEKMPEVYDEPIADISIIPTYMVSQLARKYVKAVMSGEGADEAFGGYHWQKEFYAKHHPKGFLPQLKSLFNKPDTLSFYANAMSMGNFDREELRAMLQPNFHQYIAKDVHWFYRKHLKPRLSPLKQIQYLDVKCFMGELVLVKVDRASMANSLEVRVPFLDRELFEKIFKTNEQSYYKQDGTKFVLKEQIKDHLPPEILARNKQGFVGPDSYYMNKEWYQNQLKNSKLVHDQIIKASYIDALLAKDYDWRIWKILVMEKWYTRWAYQ